jgi:hypothetical protein
MVPGVNRVFAHEGKNYHLQAEDLGVEQACFEARVYEGGTVLWRKRIAYADLVAQKLAQVEQDTALRLLMEKTLNTVQAAIAKGKLA